MKYGITGASGQLGRLTTAALAERVAADDIVLITRDPSGLNGADVRRGDFSDPATLPAAFAGIDRLLLVSTDDVAHRLAGQMAAIEAAVAAGVQRIAYTSITSPSDSNPAFVVPSHRATELVLIQSGVEFVCLRNAIYMEILAAGAPAAIASGTLLTNAGDGRAVHVAREDCAAVAAAVLADDEHANKLYDVTGEEAYDAEALAALYTELSGTAVTVQHADDDAWVAAMTARGLPEPMARGYASFGEAQRRGYAGIVASTVRDITGRAPRSLRDVLAAALAR